jgi:hypothetical protein
MFRLILPGCALLLLVAGCAPVREAPSLEPRAAEAIDPRLPVIDRSEALAADPAFAAELGAVRQRALAAARAAEPAIASATRAAMAAETSCCAAIQLSLSRDPADPAARAPFTAALGDLDRTIALRVRSRGRLVPQDLAAADGVIAEVAALDRAQASALARAASLLQR